MRYHVPFAHRQHHSRNLGPVYIGFDEPVSIQRRKRPFNWYGFTGLLMSLVSPFTLFLIAPLALLFSLLGMRRAPRGMALVGLILSLLATTVLSIGVFNLLDQHQRQRSRQLLEISHIQNRPQIEATLTILESVQDELRQFRSENDNQLPSLDDGMMMTVRYDDAWDQPLRYGVTEAGCIIRSSGPDQEFDTADDLTVKLDGQPMSFDLIETELHPDFDLDLE